MPAQWRQHSNVQSFVEPIARHVKCGQIHSDNNVPAFPLDQLEAPPTLRARADEGQVWPVAEARYETATSHPLRRSTNAPAITSFACGVAGLALQLPLTLFLFSRQVLAGNALAESLLLTVLPFLAILFGAIGLDQISARHQRGRGLAGMGLAIGILEFVPILLVLFSQAD